MSFTVCEFRAPSAWASYLINGDASGMEDAEIKECDAWLDRIGLGAPVDCTEDGFGILFPDHLRAARYCGDISVYSFLEGR